MTVKTRMALLALALISSAAGVRAGSVSFGPERKIASIQNGKGLDASDMDGDGYVDIVHSHSSTNDDPSIRLNRNNGATSPVFIASSVSDGIGFYIKTVDINRDGTRDIVALANNLYWFDSSSTVGAKKQPPAVQKANKSGDRIFFR